MTNKEGKVISIGDYTQWLNCNYKLSLTTTVKDDKLTGLNNAQLCSNNPLQNYLER